MSTLRVLQLLVLSVFLVAVAGVFVGRWLDPTRRLAAAHLARPTPFVLPDFQLADERGQPITKSVLAGHIWVADFLFLQCGDTCARLSRRLAKLQRSTRPQPWGVELRFVSFSVDADDDRAALRRFRRGYERERDPRWLLAAADRRSFPGLAVGMGLADADRDIPDAFVASSRFLFLVDGDGIVRDSYDGFSDRDSDRLARDLETLARGQKASP